MNSETPAGTIEIPVLDDDLIREVLLRLPVKSLLKFRSVSKAWLSYISSPEFVKAHLSFSTNNNEYTHHLLMLNYSLALTGRYEYNFKDCCLRSLFDEPATEAFDVDCPIKSHWLFKKAIHSFSIVGSVNGIVCLAINNFILCLWNPSTSLMHRLPTSKPNLSLDDSQIYGFGYDQVRDDYKVAVIICVGRSDLVQLRIYSLRSGSWTRGGCALDGVLLDVSGKFVSGKLHWPATTPGRNMYEGWNILSLDLVKTKWNKVDQPSYGDGDVVLWLGVLGNDLSVFCNHKDENVDVWVMKEYGVKESWSKMFTIKYPYDPRVDYGFICFPSFMSHIGEILVYFGSNFMIYNPRSESFRCANVINFNDWREAGVYAESLVSPIPPKSIQ